MTDTREIWFKEGYNQARKECEEEIELLKSTNSQEQMGRTKIDLPNSIRDSSDNRGQSAVKQTISHTLDSQEGHNGAVHVSETAHQDTHKLEEFIERAEKLDKEGIRAVCGTDKEYSDYVDKVMRIVIQRRRRLKKNE